jgi:hypothetical protein
MLPFGIKNAEGFDMTLKTASFFALTGMALLTVLLTVNLIVNVSGVARGFIPMMTMLTYLVQWLASLGLLVFFAVFYGKQ